VFEIHIQGELSGEWKRHQKEDHAMKVEASLPIPKMLCAVGVFRAP